MGLLPLEIPAGILKVDSPNAGKGRYIDSDKIRFVNNFAEKWRGWRRFLDETLIGIARGAVSWTNVYGNTNVAFGTHLKLYAITGGDLLTDITPIRASSTINNNPFVTTNGSKIVTVTDTAHGAEAGDFVTYSGATAVGGITIVGEYQIVTKLGVDSYTIEHTSAASSGATGGGASVVAAYQASSGSIGGIAGLGWGAGPYGAGTWGTERTEGIPVDARHWSLQEYGNDLIASPSGGALYLWQEATDARAEIVAGAPTEIRAMFLTGERYIFALGTVTPMTVQWPDQDDITDWIPGTGDTANQRVLQSGSKLIAGTAVSDGINIVWSDTSVYLFQFLPDNDLIYDSRLLGTNCGLVGPLAFARVSGSVLWRSGKTFFMYAGGSVTQIPRSGDIEDFVNSDMDPSQSTKMWAEYDESNKQVRWHYCSLGSSEPDKYVDVDITNFSWTTGTLSRTTGTKYLPTAETMLMVDPDGVIYEHNVGSDADGEAIDAFITYGLYALAGGAVNVDIFGIIPDCKRQSGDLEFEVYTRERPNSEDNFDEGTTSIGEGGEIADIRLSGRHFGMTIRSNMVGGDFRLGIVNLEIGQSGERR